MFMDFVSVIKSILESEIFSAYLCNYKVHTYYWLETETTV
jgi:hypothetical protein